MLLSFFLAFFLPLIFQDPPWLLFGNRSDILVFLYILVFPHIQDIQQGIGYSYNGSQYTYTCFLWCIQSLSRIFQLLVFETYKVPSFLVLVQVIFGVSYIVVMNLYVQFWTILLDYIIDLSTAYMYRDFLF